MELELGWRIQRFGLSKVNVHIFGALLEFELNLIREDTKARLAAARMLGRQGGRPKKLSSNKRSPAVDLYHGKKHSLKQICQMLDISKPTLYKYIQDSTLQ